MNAAADRLRAIAEGPALDLPPVRWEAPTINEAHESARWGGERCTPSAYLLPKGTHHYQDFIRPSELARWLREAGLQLDDVSGLAYEPWLDRARLTRRTDVNYIASAIKPDATQGG